MTLTSGASAGDTSLSVTLTGDIPAGTKLTFGGGMYARTTALEESSEVTISVAALKSDIPNGSTATYVKVRKCLYGTRQAITWGMNKNPMLEALRDKDTTHDYVRAEQNYGALVLEPYALGTVSVTEVS